jgi:perosamine synthetase
MTPVTAAIGIGQLENIELMLNYRIKAATKYKEAIKNCEWLVPQPTNQDGVNHTYYTFGVRFLGLPKRNLTWAEFYNRFTEAGGDGFYANCKNPYLEPIFHGKRYGNQLFMNGLCPIAEKLQREIMAFKTNYLDDGVLTKQAELLSNLIDEIGR